MPGIDILVDIQLIDLKYVVTFMKKGQIAGKYTKAKLNTSHFNHNNVYQSDPNL